MIKKETSASIIAFPQKRREIIKNGKVKRKRIQTR